jgi:hypothetical protein
MKYLRTHGRPDYHLLDEEAYAHDRSGYPTLCGDHLHPDDRVYVALYLDSRIPAEPCHSCEQAHECRQLQADGSQELLDAVDALAEAMKFKIATNRHKRRLDECNYSHLLGRIDEEIAELNRALTQWQHGPATLDDLLLEAADVANFALFVWVKARREEHQKQQETHP